MRASTIPSFTSTAAFSVMFAWSVWIVKVDSWSIVPVFASTSTVPGLAPTITLPVSAKVTCRPPQIETFPEPERICAFTRMSVPVFCAAIRMFPDPFALTAAPAIQ